MLIRFNNHAAYTKVVDLCKRKKFKVAVNPQNFILFVADRSNPAEANKIIMFVRSATLNEHQIVYSA